MDSVKEQIMKAIVAKLEAITTANGYANTVANVQRYGLAGLSFSSVPFLYVSQGDDLLLREKKAFPFVQRECEVFVAVVHRPDSSETRSGDEVLNSLCRDVERCLMADKTQGGTAIMTDNPDVMECTVETDLPHLAVAMRFPVQYRHHFQHPEQAA